MNPNTHLPPNFLAALRSVVRTESIYTDPATCQGYAYDNSRRYSLPQVVVLAQTEEDVRGVVTTCYRHRVPVVARGRGTGTTGSAVPIAGGVVLSLERMHRIVRIDPDNRYAVVEPGVTNQTLQDALAPHGFFWPPDPTSAAYATIGGNLAFNSAGPRAVKYGTPRDNTLGLRVITGTGESMRVGTYTTKGVVGYDLTRLLIGSEGTLAITTEATLKLTPLPETQHSMLALYRDMHSAARAVSRIMAQPVTPCALEFMDAKAIAMIRDYSKADIPQDAGALLIIEVDGSHAAIADAVAGITRAAQVDGSLRIQTAATAEQRAALWTMRKALSPALRTIAPKKINEDVAVPVSAMPEFLARLEQITARYRITNVNFGHAGNGNIHVNLLINPDDAGEAARAYRCLDEIFDLVLALNGTLSGEHGVGLEKRDYVARELDPVALQLMRQIKTVFDPAGILNPGKVWVP